MVDQLKTRDVQTAFRHGVETPPHSTPPWGGLRKMLHPMVGWSTSKSSLRFAPPHSTPPHQNRLKTSPHAPPHGGVEHLKSQKKVLPPTPPQTGVCSTPWWGGARGVECSTPPHLPWGGAPPQNGLLHPMVGWTVHPYSRLLLRWN